MSLKPLKLSSLILLTAFCGCGGGGTSESGGDSSSTSSSSSSSSSGAIPYNTFIDATINVGENPKQLTFNWIFNGTAAAFRVEIDPDGVSGYSQVDLNGDQSVDAESIYSVDYVRGDAEMAEVPIELLNTNLINAQYQVVALDSDGNELDRSAELPISGIANEKLVGYFKASNSQQDDAFGYSTAISWDGTILAVGAPFEGSDADGVSSDGTGEDNDDAQGSGAVYIFAHNEDGTWVREAYIKASNSDRGDSFGLSIALSSEGDTLVVGAPYEDSSFAGISTDGTGEEDNSFDGAGAVYVFTRDENEGWSQQAYIKASNVDGLDYFGYSISLSGGGDTFIVGAPNEDSNYQGVSTNGEGEANEDEPGSGAAYIFRRNDAGQWLQHAYVKASNTQINDNFGRAVAISGNGYELAVGAIQEKSSATGIDGNQNDNSMISAGAVYVFSMLGGTTWIQRAYVKASNTGMNDYFGHSLSMSVDGNTLAVGASSEWSSAVGVITNGDGESDDSAPGAGAVYIFTQNDMYVWSQQAYIKASNTQDDEDFGYYVSLSGPGDTLAVGAPREDSDDAGVSMGSPSENGGAFRSGAAYLFVRDDNGWTQHAHIKASNTEAGDGFGRSVALSSDSRALAVGANEEGGSASFIGGDQENNEEPGAGAVYIY